MNIADFIAYLQQFPSDTEVRVAIGHYEEVDPNWSEHEPFDGINGVEYVDYNDSSVITPPYSSHLVGKRVLFIGDGV
jgi:hypothetical protein